MITQSGDPKDNSSQKENKQDKKEDNKNDKNEKQTYNKNSVDGDEPVIFMNSIKYRGDSHVELPHKILTHPRHYGKDSRYCRVCRNTHGLIQKYGLNICRRCFRERANLLGFKCTK